MTKLSSEHPKDFFVTNADLDASQVLIEEHFSIKEDDKHGVAFNHEGKDYTFSLKDSELAERLLTLAERFLHRGTYVSLEEIGAWNLELVSLEKQFNAFIDSTLEPLDQGLKREIFVVFTNRSKRDFKSFIDTVRDFLDISLKSTDIEQKV